MTYEQVYQLLLAGVSTAQILLTGGNQAQIDAGTARILAAAQAAAQPLAPVVGQQNAPAAQPAPQAQQNYFAQAAPVAAVHTVQMPFPIDSQGVKFVPSLPTWVIWTLSVLLVLVIAFLVIMASVWSSKPAAVTPDIPKTLKIEFGKVDVNVTGVLPGKP